MAKAPTTARKPAAPRPAAAKADAAPTTAAKAADGFATIKIDKDKHGAVVRGAVNGQPFEFKTGSDIPVTEAQLGALTDSHIEFTTVSPPAGVDADEGSSASTTVSGTAIRAEEPNLPKVGEDGKPLETPELRQITDKELTEGADQTTSKESVEAEQKA